MEKKNNLAIDHISLVILLAGGLALFWLYRGFPGYQLNVAVFVSFLYVLWGVVHHYLKGELHTRIVIEYSLVALLAVILIRGALIR